MKSLLNVCLCIFISFFCWSCTEPTAHGVTDIGNSMAGVVIAEDGKPLSNVRVVLYYDDWEAESISDSLETKTNTKGEFEFKNVSSEESIVILAKKESLSALSLGSDTLVLRSSKFISSRILGKSGGWVRVLGQNQKQDVAEDGSFTFANTPSGELALIYGESEQGDLRFVFKTMDSRDSLLLPDLMEVESKEHWLQLADFRYYTEDGYDGIQAIDFYENEIEEFTLTYSLKEFVPQETLHHFVLPVRLDSTNFDFDSWDDSTEIMLTSTDEASLAFEFDHFDPASKTALLWVRFDSIPSKAESVKIRFKKSAWLKQTPFQKEEGVMAVLHMEELENLVSQDLPILSDSGFIGRGVSLAPSQYLDLDTLDPCSSDFTLSLWVYWYGKNGNHQILFSQRSFWSDSTSRFQWHFDYFNDVFAVYNNIDQRNKFKEVEVPVDEWAYLTLLFKDGELSMFVNGVRIGEPAAFVPTELNEAVPLRVGGNEVDVETWNGVLDEVRVEKVARSEEWIRFSYEVQKAVKNK